MRNVHVFAPLIAVTTVLGACATTVTHGTGVHRGIQYSYTHTMTPGSFGSDEESYSVSFRGRAFHCGSDLLYCFPLIDQYLKEQDERMGPPENPVDVRRVPEGATTDPGKMLEDRQFGD